MDSVPIGAARVDEVKRTIYRPVNVAAPPQLPNQLCARAWLSNRTTPRVTLCVTLLVFDNHHHPTVVIIMMYSVGDESDEANG